MFCDERRIFSSRWLSVSFYRSHLLLGATLICPSQFRHLATFGNADRHDGRRHAVFPDTDREFHSQSYESVRLW